MEDFHCSRRWRWRNSKTEKLSRNHNIQEKEMKTFYGPKCSPASSEHFPKSRCSLVPSSTLFSLPGNLSSNHAEAGCPWPGTQTTELVHLGDFDLTSDQPGASNWTLKEKGICSTLVCVCCVCSALCLSILLSFPGNRCLPGGAASGKAPQGYKGALPVSLSLSGVPAPAPHSSPAPCSLAPWGVKPSQPPFLSVGHPHMPSSLLSGSHERQHRPQA